MFTQAESFCAAYVSGFACVCMRVCNFLVAFGAFLGACYCLPSFCILSTAAAEAAAGEAAAAKTFIK